MSGCLHICTRKSYYITETILSFNELELDFMYLQSRLKTVSTTNCFCLLFLKKNYSQTTTKTESGKYLAKWGHCKYNSEWNL